MADASRAELLTVRHRLRVEVLRALVAGERVESTSLAEAHGLSPASTDYHLSVLADAGAITVADGEARITQRGEELYELSLRSERRQVRDRRRGPRRQADWDDE
jgi:DNA-binding transcriptional ArsR family regulator